MKKLISLLMAVFLLLSALAGCGLKPSEDRIERGDELKTTGELTDRYNAYHTLYEQIVAGAVNAHIKRYFEDIAYQSSFESLNGSYPADSRFSENDHKALEAAYAYAQSESEYADVDGAVIALYPALKQVMEKLDEAFTYGARRDYLEDSFGKAEAIHSELYSLIDTYCPLGRSFVKEFGNLRAAKQDQYLQTLEDNGYELRYTMLKILSVVEILNSEFYMQNTVHSENIYELELTSITPLYYELSSLVLNCSTYVKDSKIVEYEGFDPMHDSADLQRFVKCAVEMKECMAAIIQRVEENDTPTEEEIKHVTAHNGTFEAFDSIYSELVDNYYEMIDSPRY